MANEQVESLRGGSLARQPSLIISYKPVIRLDHTQYGRAVGVVGGGELDPAGVSTGKSTSVGPSVS